MDGFYLHPVQICYVVIVYQSNINSLCEVDPCVCFSVLSHQISFFSASGNVRVWYDDYHAKGPKINVYPGKDGKPNDIYFVGRSSISQGVRTIYADKIQMKLKPKDFRAEGNTRTVIKNIGSNDNGNSGNSGMTLGL